MSLMRDFQLFQGYIRHIAPRWPILQTPFIRLLHTERSTLSDAFLSVSMLSYPNNTIN
jgi:hypothetical protein